MSPGRKRLISNYENTKIKWDFNQDVLYDENIKIGSNLILI